MMIASRRTCPARRGRLRLPDGGQTWGSPWNRLPDANPRPTHYEYIKVRDTSFRFVPPHAVVPDQSMYEGFRRDTLCYLVQRRPAALRPHMTSAARHPHVRAALSRSYRRAKRTQRRHPVHQQHRMPWQARLSLRGLVTPAASRTRTAQAAHPSSAQPLHRSRRP
jgi:hypothetical protein